MLRAMATTRSATLTSHSSDNTAQIALMVAPVLSAGQTLCLQGALGAGKSLFARTIIRALTDEIDIPSPTFTIVQTYDAPAFEIWHADLYRLTDAAELNELGLHDATQTALCLVEWPDQLGFSPPDALWIRFDTTEDPDHRSLAFTATGDRWSDLFSVLERYLK